MGKRGPARIRHALYEFIENPRLEKGMVVPPEVLEPIVGCRRDSARYGVAVLNVGQMLTQRRGISCCVEGNALRLMTDAEALRYHLEQAAIASRKLERAADSLRRGIDRKQLNDNEKIVHDHGTRMVVAMAEAQRKEKEKGRRILDVLAATRRLPPSR